MAASPTHRPLMPLPTCTFTRPFPFVISLLLFIYFHFLAFRLSGWCHPVLTHRRRLQALRCWCSRLSPSGSAGCRLFHARGCRVTLFSGGIGTATSGLHARAFFSRVTLSAFPLICRLSLHCSLVLSFALRTSRHGTRALVTIFLGRNAVVHTARLQRLIFLIVLLVHGSAAEPLHVTRQARALPRAHLGTEGARVSRTTAATAATGTAATATATSPGVLAPSLALSAAAAAPPPAPAATATATRSRQVLSLTCCACVRAVRF